MAPIILELKKCAWANVRVLASAQHRELLDRPMATFGIKPDIDLDIMQPGQQLAQLTSRLIEGLDKVLRDEKPDVVLGQGDTTTVFATALACFYLHIPFAHVEAGLRSYDFRNPFPEEANRILAGHLSSFHFSPTEQSKKNLLKEGIKPDRIFVTGNSVIDALHLILKDHAKPVTIGKPGVRKILVTAHRRENFGEPLLRICQALKTIARRSDIEIILPVHPNPNVTKIFSDQLGGLSNVYLIPPMDYMDFIPLMKESYLILTDSGGVQEEAPALGKPVLVMRETTERPEAKDFGVVELVGTDEKLIVERVFKLLDDETFYKSMAKGVSPYGDGKTSERIRDILHQVFVSDPSSLKRLSI